MNNVLIRRVEVGDDLVLEFWDHSNRYFGDYHRVLIEVDALIQGADRTVRLRYQRPLRRMGVCSVATVRTAEILIEQFLMTAVPYMAQVGFAQKILSSLRRPGQRLWKTLS